jgi:ATP-dependent Lon protease
MAAARSGLKHAILPDQNRNEWLDVPSEVREKMEVHFVKNISDLIKTALRPK